MDFNFLRSMLIMVSAFVVFNINIALYVNIFVSLYIEYIDKYLGDVLCYHRTVRDLFWFTCLKRLAYVNTKVPWICPGM